MTLQSDSSHMTSPRNVRCLDELLLPVIDFWSINGVLYIPSQFYLSVTQKSTTAKRKPLSYCSIWERGEEYFLNVNGKSSQIEFKASTLTRRYLQGPGVSRRTEALATFVVALCTVQALALKQAVLAVEVGLAGLLAPPALVAICADAGSCDWVTFGPVPTLTAIRAVGTPEVTFTG